MSKWLKIRFGMFKSVFRSQPELALENLALRQQRAVLKHYHSRPRCSDSDRLFWVMLSRMWKGWRVPLDIVQPAPVVRRHR